MKLKVFLKYLALVCLIYSGNGWSQSSEIENPQKLYLVLNGVSKHFNVDSKYDNAPLNEKNWGLGIEYQFPHKASDSLRWMVNLGQFHDSFNTNAFYAGGAGLYDLYRKNYWYVQTGIQLAFFNSPSYNGGTPFVAPLPIISLGTDAVAANITIIPRLNQIMDAGVVFMQFKVKMN
jgi:Antimicrobial peptide resistance and lipid A acylation protein PagP